MPARLHLRPAIAAALLAGCGLDSWYPDGKGPSGIRDSGLVDTAGDPGDGGAGDGGAGDGGGGDGGGDTGWPGDNRAPVAEAGGDQVVSVGDAVVLDGSLSYDPDGDELDWDWQFASIPSGSAATLVDADGMQPTFVADAEGDFEVVLVVSDGALSSDPDMVVVTAVRDNTPPVADAGPDQSVRVGDTVHLDGTGSSDADGDALSYAWSFSSRPSGSVAVLSNAAAPAPAFTADVAGTYVLELVVDDGTESSDPDEVRVTASEPSGGGGGGGGGGSCGGCARAGEVAFKTRLAAIFFGLPLLWGLRRRP